MSNVNKHSLSVSSHNKLNTRCQLNCGQILKIGKALYIL